MSWWILALCAPASAATPRRPAVPLTCEPGAAEVVHQGSDAPPWPWLVDWNPVWETRSVDPRPQLTAGDGTVRWCAREDGVRHGPYVAFRGFGTTTGRFVDGRPDGVWHEWGGGYGRSWHRSWRMRRGTGTMTWHDRDGLPLTRIRYRDGEAHGRFTTSVYGDWRSRGRFERGVATGTWRARMPSEETGEMGPVTHRIRFAEGVRAGPASGLDRGLYAQGTFVADLADGLWTLSGPGAPSPLHDPLTKLALDEFDREPELQYEVRFSSGTGTVPVRAVTPDGAGRARYVTVLVDGHVVAQAVATGDEAPLANVPGDPSTFALADCRTWCDRRQGHRVTLSGSGGRRLHLGGGTGPEICAGSPPSPGDPCTAVRFEDWEQGLRERLAAAGIVASGPGIGACELGSPPGVEHAALAVYDWGDANAALRILGESVAAWGLAGPVALGIEPPAVGTIVGP